MGKHDDKTEKPTAKRKKELRKQGRVAKSQDFAVWIGVYVITLALPAAISRGTNALGSMILGLGDVMADPQPSRMLTALGRGAGAIVSILLPVLLLLAGLAIVTNVAQTGFHVSTKAIKPTFKKLNPINGFKRMLSPQSFWEAGKGMGKTAVIAAVAYPAVRRLVNDLAGGERLSLWSTVGLVGGRAIAVVRDIAMAGLLIAFADVVYQKRKIRKESMMSKQEIRDEHKNSEGNPEIKGRIRARQQAVARSRMFAAIANADVVIVNPVHVAVALRYEPTRGAPRVVAKGKGPLAERIRDRAEEHAVPIVESIPLARALFAACDLEDEIPAEMYEAVARVLAFVHRLGRRRPLGGPIHRLPDALAMH